MAAALTIDQNTSVAGDGAFIATRGTGFTNAGSVSFYVGGIYAGEVPADSGGNFDAQVQIPRELAAGSWEILATDETESDSAAFTVS